MKEIKIQNSNLYLKVIDIGGTSLYTLGSDKKKMRYQFAVTEEVSTGRILHYFTYGDKCIHFPDKVQKKLYLLVKEKKKFSENIKLSLEDTIDVLKFLKEFVYYYPLQSEPIVMALREERLLETYQRSFGDGIKYEFIPFIQSFIQDPTQLRLSDSNDGFIWRGERRRYSVINLLQELKTTGAKIRMANDVFKYDRVSLKSIDKSGNQVQYLDKFGDITSISEAKTKPNISISYNAYINITTPSGVEYKDFTTPRRICVMKNGSLNTKYLCIQSNDKKFIGKLKRLGVLYTKLIKNEYILDLSKIPLFTKKDIKIVLYWMLTEYEYYYQCYKFQKEYVKFKIGKNNLEEEKKEIDIDNKVYSPRTVSRKSNVSYITQVMETKIHNREFPDTAAKRLIAFNNFATLPKDSIPYKLILEIENNSEQDLQKILKEVHKKVNHYSNLLNNARFNLMLSKNPGFRFGIGTLIYGLVRTVSGKYGDLQISWNCKKIKEYSYN